MIYGKMWCVVRPSLGVPLIIGAVAVGSFAVHVALLTHTDWVPQFLNGGPPAAKAAALVVPAEVATLQAPQAEKL